ncbi:MAG: grasp-with-spasm system SPASM domain peptide maturase [Bacteroidota bacterium]
MKDFRKSDLYLIVYSNCIPVKGAVRSTICDLQNHRYYYIPNDLFDLLSKLKKKPLHNIYRSFSKENYGILDEYFDFLMTNELAFLDSQPELFPDLNRDWSYPGQVSNAIIDLNKRSISKIDYSMVIDELSNLNCECLQIRSFEGLTINDINKILLLTTDTRLNELRLVLYYSYDVEEIVENFILKNKRITEVIFHGCDRTLKRDIFGVPVIFTGNVLTAKDCGQVCLQNFSVNIKHFTESLKFNSCLNRKISIDEYGLIKNCPSSNKSYGSIKEKTLTEVLMNQEFKKLWKIKKDDVEVCKDCEYRYICTDCRVFTKGKDSYGKPEKCTYDPYEAQWN